jgi:hypothetical protein
MSVPPAERNGWSGVLIFEPNLGYHSFIQF